MATLPARFRRQRVLIIGCGDVGLRLAARCPSPIRVLALTSSPERVPELRRAGIVPLVGNLDQFATLQRLSGLAQRIVHLAPPPGHGWIDQRTRNLLPVLSRRTVPSVLVYASTSGVYGNRDGNWVAETDPIHPETPRAHRRADAEHRVRFWARAMHTRTVILRVPGIYAPDREGGTPEARLRKATPVLRDEDDVYTNHIHADDLARACLLAVWRSRPQRIYNVNDDSQMKMGEYFDWAANHYGLPKPPRIARADAAAQLPAMMLSFMQESRRMRNDRIKQELGLRLLYPTVRDGLI